MPDTVPRDDFKMRPSSEVPAAGRTAGEIPADVARVAGSYARRSEQDAERVRGHVGEWHRLRADLHGEDA